MEKTGIVIEDLSLHYGEHTIYEDFNLSFEPNQIVSILGPSGCGKTTLLNAIVGLTAYTKGTIGGVLSQGFGYVFQEPRLIPWLTVEKNLDYALSHTMAHDLYMEKRKASLEVLDLKNKLSRYPHQLSGGEQQRVALARAFLKPSEGLLMDEAFKGLDLVTKQAILTAFLKLWKLSPKTVIAVSHDVSEAVMISDRILLFSKSPVTILQDLKLKPHQVRSQDEQERLALIADIRAEIQKK
jgi:NitT/TauT family transport system ATP-binding protein